MKQFIRAGYPIKRNFFPYKKGKKRSKYICTCQVIPQSYGLAICTGCVNFPAIYGRQSVISRLLPDRT